MPSMQIILKWFHCGTGLIRFSVGNDRFHQRGFAGIMSAPCVGKMSPSEVYQLASYPAMIWTSIPLRKGCPGAVVAPVHTKTPALDIFWRCCHCSSSMKFSYIFLVRSMHMGLPVHLIILSCTVHVFSWPLMSTQLLRFLPLKSGR